MLHKTVNLFADRGVDNTNIKLKTYITENLNGAKRPAVIVMPGGAFIFMGTREGEGVALAFAAEGYQAFVLEYSTLNTAPDSSGVENMLEQVQEAMTVIQEHSDEWCVDADRISLCGFSAGACLAACYSTFYKENGWPGPHAVILSYPVLDPLFNIKWLEENGADNETRIMMSRTANKALFGTEEPTEEQYRLVSPIYNVEESRGIPPTFIWHTFGDELVAATQSLEYAALLYKAGVPVEVHAFQTGGHALALATAVTAAGEQDIDPAVAAWFGLALKWLENLE